MTLLGRTVRHLADASSATALVGRAAWHEQVLDLGIKGIELDVYDTKGVHRETSGSARLRSSGAREERTSVTESRSIGPRYSPGLKV